MFVITFMAYDI